MMISLFRRLACDVRGNAAMMVGLCLFVLATAAAGALDYSQFLVQKRTAQDALDSAALAVAISPSKDQATLKALALEVFTQNTVDRKVTAAISTYNLDTAANAFSLSAAGTYKPYMLSLIGLDNLPYTVKSDTVRAADGTLEIALVLDNTWSMSSPLDGSQSKIQVLKTAANSLISSVMVDANAGYVKMAIVPYADYVNVGTANRFKSWVSVPADTTTTTPQTCTTQTTKTTCTGGTMGTCTGNQDGVPFTYNCWQVPQTCTTQTVAPYQSCWGGYSTNYKWFGCVLNQVQSGSLAMPDPATPYFGISSPWQSCLNPIQPLTNDSAVLTSAINGLVVNIGGYKPETYIPGGLIWGVNVLSPPEPFGEGAGYDAANKQPRKTLVLMTDGANTLATNASGQVYVANAAQLAQTYSDQIKVCDYAKSKNIEIYTIGFGVTDNTALAKLKACATDAAHYFDAQSSADLVAAFKTIGGQLTAVRITR